jgi:uncharacterized protein YoxC
VTQLQKNIDELKEKKAGLEGEIRGICDEKEDLLQLMNRLERDRDRLMEKINRLTENGA